MSSVVTTPVAPEPAGEAASTRKRRGVPGLRGTGVVGHAAALVILAAVFVAAFGPALAPHDPDQMDLSNAFAGTIPGHLLGLDSQGRDIVSRLLVGARASLLGPLLVVVLSIVGIAFALGYIVGQLLL